MKGVLYTIIITILLVSCSKEQLPQLPSDGGAIYLAAISEVSADTRAPYKYTTPNGDADGILYTEVWASSECNTATNDYTFPNSGLDGKDINGNPTAVAIHTKADFDSGVPQLLNQAVYPSSGTPVYFVGLHPQSDTAVESPNKWELSNDNKMASFTFDGSHDVMFAPRVGGQYSTDNNIGTTYEAPVLSFKHLLTWLKFNIIAEDEKTAQAWGKIKKMQITSKNRCNVNIGYTGVFQVDDDNYVSYDNNDNADDLLDLHQVGTDTVFPSVDGYTLKYFGQISKHEQIAYILCSPVVPIVTEVEDGKDVHKPEYILHIESEYRKVEVPIDLKVNAGKYFGEETDETTTRSRSFTINLTFKMGNTIVVSAGVTDWSYGGNNYVEL